MKNTKQELTLLIFGIFLFAVAMLPVTAFAQDYEDSPFGFIQGEIIDHTPVNVDLLLDLSVHWDRYLRRNGRVIITNDSLDFKSLDNMVQLLLVDNKINMTCPLSFYKENQQVMTLSEYSAFCKKVVERYDGDGIDDMPGSPVVKYWVVGFNEIDLAYKKDPDLFAVDSISQFIRIGYDSVMAENPQNRVILGGSGNSAEAWDTGGYYQQLVSYMGADNMCPDIIFDYHLWSRPNDYKLQVLVMESIVRPALQNAGYLNNDLWTTEGGSWDGGNQNFPESAQAEDVVRRYTYSLAHGQSKLFWTRIVEFNWTPGDSSMFDFIGLVNNPANNDGLSHKKLAYYTYKLMVEKLEGSDWNNIQTIRESDNIYIYKFTKQGEPVWVAWWDYFDDTGTSKTITLNVGDINSVKITEVVPNAESGDDLNKNDYPNFFQTEVETVSSGEITITLGESPVFVEEYNATSVHEVISYDYNIKIYPNPTTGIFTIEGENIQSVEIININGQTIKQLSTDNKQYILDLREHSKGVYMIKIVTDSGISVEKVVLE